MKKFRVEVVGGGPPKPRNGLTEAQKEEFLQAFCSIIVSFVEMGFGVHPLQAVCGEEPQTDAKDAKDAFNVVGSDQPENDEKTNDFSP